MVHLEVIWRKFGHCGLGIGACPPGVGCFHLFKYLAVNEYSFKGNRERGW